MPLSTQRKLEIIQSISDEIILQKNVLMPLYQNMGAFEQVHYSHGANENGTDIVLVQKSVFGEYIYTGVIVKSKPINNATTGNQTSANIIQQITLASATGFNCTIQKKKIKFDTILVVTNKTVSNTARQTLIDYSNSNGVPRLNFQLGDDLVNLIDKYLPDFYFYQSGLHAQLALALRAKCEKLSDLQNLPQFSVQDKALIDVFVKPQLRFMESKKSEGQRKNRVVIENFDTVMEKNTRILLTGEPGSGKTIILRQFVLNTLSENASDRSPIFPILVKASDLAKQEGNDFNTVFNAAVQSYYGIANFDLQLISKEQIILLIDGLDEIVSNEQKLKVRDLIFEYDTQNPSVKIVVASRVTKEITNLTTLSNYKRWEILSFNYAQVQSFIGKWFTNRSDKSSRLLAALEDHDLLAKLPNTPLALTLLAILFDSDNFREIPSNLAELYKMFIDLLLGRWSLDRRVENLFDANIREYVLKEIALHFHKNGITKADSKTILTIIEQCKANLARELSSQDMLVDFIEQSALLLINENEEIEFRHLSFQEFLVGLHMFKKGNNEGRDFLIQNFRDSWWGQVLYFYCGLRQENSDVLEKLVEDLHDYDMRDKMLGVLNMGYLIQSSYLTPAEIRLNIIEGSIREYYIVLSGLEKVKVADQVMPEGVAFIAFMMWLSNFYTSKPLQELYQKLFDKIDNPTNNEENGFVLLALAIFLGDIGDLQYLVRAHNAVKNDGKQLLALDFFGELSLKELPEGKRKSIEVAEVKEMLNKIKKWFKNRPTIIKYLTESTTTPTVET